MPIIRRPQRCGDKGGIVARPFVNASVAKKHQSRLRRLPPAEESSDRSSSGRTMNPPARRSPHVARFGTKMPSDRRPISLVLSLPYLATSPIHLADTGIRPPRAFQPRRLSSEGTVPSSSQLDRSAATCQAAATTPLSGRQRGGGFSRYIRVPSAEARSIATASLTLRIVGPQERRRRHTECACYFQTRPRYSTVTLFARLRGLSTSQFLATAM